MKKRTADISSVRTVLTSTAADAVDFVLTLIAAVISGSAVMSAKILQITADLVADGFLYRGVRRANQPADSKYPFGYGRAVFIWTAAAALVMLIVTATFSFFLAWRRWLAPVTVEFIELSLFALTVSLLVNSYAATVSSRRVFGSNKKDLLRRFIYSPRAEGKMAFLGDVLGVTSAAVGLLSLAGYYFFDYLLLDAIGAAVIGFLLAGSALIVITGVKYQLLGGTVAPETWRAIYQVAAAHPAVNSVIDLKAVSIGPDTILVAMEVHFHDDLDTDQIERVIDGVENAIQKTIPQAKYIQIEPETPVL